MPFHDRRTFIRDLAAGALAGTVPVTLPASREPVRRSSQAPLDGLERRIEEALAGWRVPGAAVAVVRNDQVLYAKGHGVRQTGDPTPVDADTLFQIGSTTKAFTTAALGLLADERKLGWDDPVQSHLPELELADPWIGRNLTVRDAVSHRSGFRDFTGPAVEIIDAAETVRRMRFSRSFDRFRDSYNYSNAMFGVAGRVVERVSGQAWGDFVRSRLLEPLGMSRTRTSPYQVWDRQFVTPTFLGTAPAGEVSRRQARDPNVAMPHTLEDGAPKVIPWQSYDNMAAAGSMVSSANEMARWLLLHLNGGRAGGRQLLAAETVAELHRPQNLRDSTRAPFDPGSGAYALGWHRETYRGEPTLSHGGGILGFPAHTFLLPSRMLGVVVLANGRTPSTEDYAIPGFDHYSFHRAIALWIYDRILGAPVTEWQQYYLARVAEHERERADREAKLQAARLVNSHPSLPLSRYAGEYESPSGLFGRVSVEAADDHLILRFPGEGAYSARLDPWHQDLFRLRSAGVRFQRGFVSFEIGPAGRVATMRALGGEFQPVA
jgi:CubicO group peptidase (beta-lactamase class C family)